MKTTPPPEPGPGAADDLHPEYNFDYRKVRSNRFAGQVDHPPCLDDQSMASNDDMAKRDEIFRGLTLDQMIADIKRRREQIDTQLRSFGRNSEQESAKGRRGYECSAEE